MLLAGRCAAGRSRTRLAGLWLLVATLSVFVAWLVPSERRRLGVFSGFVLVLGADDTLLVHDAIGPNNGIPQEVFLGTYAMLALLLLRLMIRGSRSVLLGYLLGGALLGASVVTDRFISGLHLVEDGTKLLATLVWLTIPVIIAAQTWVAPARSLRLSQG